MTAAGKTRFINSTTVRHCLPAWGLLLAVLCLRPATAAGQSAQRSYYAPPSSNVRLYAPAEPFAVQGELPDAVAGTPASTVSYPYADSLVDSPELPDPNGGDELTLSSAAPASDAERISALEKQVSEMSKKLKEAAGGKSDKKPEKKDDKKEEKKPEKKDEWPTFKITGFTQLDSAFYRQDNLNRETIGDAQDGTGFRRARLAVNGKVAEFTAYQLEMDFATAGRPSFFDTWVEQSNLPWFGAVKCGQFCQPFSVDSLTGFRNLTFLERSLPFLAMVPFRRVGLQSANLSEDEMTQWTYSVYRAGGFNNAPLGDDRFATDIGDVGGYAFSSRATHLLQYDGAAGDRYLWHVGGGYNFSYLGANDAPGSGVVGSAGGGKNPFYESRVLPEFGTLGYSENGSAFLTGAVNGTPSVAATGKFRASDFHLIGLETVYQAGPLGLTAEAMATVVNTPFGNVLYHGAYAQAAYRLTGENRAYDKKSATLTKLVPYTDFIPLGRQGICGWGAWEVGARYSYVDLRNPSFLNGHFLDGAGNEIPGLVRAPGAGIVHDTTLGMTWFLNTHCKLQLNWIHVMLDNTIKGKSSEDLFVSRVQVDF